MGYPMKPYQILQNEDLFGGIFHKGHYNCISKLWVIVTFMCLLVILFAILQCSCICF